MDSVRGSVEKIFVDTEDFCAGQLRTHAGALVDFAGPVRVRERELVALSGHWVAHPTYGRQLRTESAAPVELHTVPERALDADAFERVRSPRRRAARASALADYGLSDRQLRSVTAAFGPEALTALHGDPYRLLEVVHGLKFSR